MWRICLVIILCFCLKFDKILLKYCYSELEKPEENLFSMLTGKVHSLPGHIQAAYVQNIMKVLSIILAKGDTQQSIKVNWFFNLNFQLVFCINYLLIRYLSYNLGLQTSVR